MFFPSSISPTDKLLELPFCKKIFSVGFLGVKKHHQKTMEPEEGPQKEEEKHGKTNIYIINFWGSMLVFGGVIMAYIQWIILVLVQGGRDYIAP